MSWKIEKSLKERLAKEKGYYPPKAAPPARIALGYPNLYRVGMSNLGLHIVYDILNRRPDTGCERFFLPEPSLLAEHKKSKTPLLTLESQRPLADFNLVAFAVSFELDYFHLPLMLELGRIAPLAAERGENAPIVIAGGPCATFNPAVLSPFIDAFVIGEGEETISRLVEKYLSGKEESLSRAEIIASLAAVPGVFVPALYRYEYDERGRIAAIAYRGAKKSAAEQNASKPIAAPRVKRQWVKNLDDYPAHSVVITDDSEFNLYLIETARGCGRHCRFCLAGYAFRRPRSRSLEFLAGEIAAAKKYGQRLGLMGAAISDYPQIDALCSLVMDSGQKMSVASFRADTVTPALVAALAASGMRTLTIAPEAGSAAMRQIINKGIEEEHLFNTVRLGLAAGIRNFKMYMMIGLPEETDADIAAIADLALRLYAFMEKDGGKLILSVNPFIPKPFTPFQWLPMAKKAALEKSLKQLQKALRQSPRIELKYESPRLALVQGILARGDERVGQAIYRAYRNAPDGDAAKYFLPALRETGIEAAFCLYREREDDEIFPWDIIDLGVKKEYLLAELRRARRREKTIPCFDGCRRCGVCS